MGMTRKSALTVIAVLSLLILLAATACKGAEGPTGPKGDPGAAGAAGAPGVSVGTISGMVKDAAGKPVEKAAVVTEPATASATTDKDGKYAIKDAPAGVYLVVASAVGLNASAARVSVLAGKEAKVDLALTTRDPFPLASVRAVAFRTGDTDVYPGASSG